MSNCKCPHCQRLKKGTRNSEALSSFFKYCIDHPQERFWQALRNWSGYGYIFADGKDTFYWEGKNTLGEE